MSTDFLPGAILARLTAARVDFVVVGGIALVAHGSDRNTFDLDICPEQSDENLDALGNVLVDLEARLRGIEEDVPFVPDGRTLARTQILTLDTTLGPLDVFARPDGSPPYDRLRRNADRVEIGNAEVLVASVDDLLEMKRSADRRKDQMDVETLEAIKRLRRRLARSGER